MTAVPLVLAVDCSTTAAKAVLFDSSGRQVASASTPLTTTSPHPGHHEQQAGDWWRATRTSVHKALRGLADPQAVRAVCITHQRETFVCIDSRGRALRPAILWLDTRASAEIAELGSERVLAISGKPPDTTPALYKLAWLARREDAVLTGAARIAEVHAYLAQRFTGRWATSTASADSLGLLDLRAGTWSPGSCSVWPASEPTSCPTSSRQERCWARSPRTSRASSACRPECRWWPASVTVRPPASVPGWSSQEPLTSTSAPRWCSGRRPSTT